MSVSYWLDSQDGKNKIQCDICVVGGGISGLSTAYWLNKLDPQLDIVVLEKSTLGSGATGRNAGFLTCGSVEHFNRMVSKHGLEQALEIWRFSEDNLQLLKQEIIGSDPASIQFLQRGAFSLAAQANEMEELKAVAELMRKNNIPVEILDAPQVSQRLGASGFVGGIKYIDDAEVNPIRLLKRIASKNKARMIENAEVKEILVDGSERVVVTSGLEVRCSIVSLCMNGYSASLSSWFADKIFPTRGQIMMLEPVAPFMEGPCYANFYLDYFRQLENGSLLIGGFRQLEADTEKGYSDHTTEKIQRALHDFVIKHLPQYQDAKVSHRWAGVMGFSVDGEAMVGSLPTDQQLFFCGGFTGHGIGSAFHTGKVLAQLIMGEKIPDWISARRF